MQTEHFSNRLNRVKHTTHLQQTRAPRHRVVRVFGSLACFGVSQARVFVLLDSTACDHCVCTTLHYFPVWLHKLSTVTQSLDTSF